MKKTKKPLAYRFGGAFFCELPFYVSKHTLIPRFDTEKLVETVILNTPEGSTVLDMCTGSGCIAVTLAKHNYDVTALDISRRALKVAKRNANLHDVKIVFEQSNLFSNLSPFSRFNVIVSNPPYIRTQEIGKWDKSILQEPQIALDGGVDGLHFYRQIIKQAPDYLTSNGKIFFEIGHDQANDIKTLLQSTGFCDIKIIKDIQGLDRVIYGRKN